MTSCPPQPTQLPHRLPEVEEVSAGGVIVDVDQGVARIAVIASLGTIDYWFSASGMRVHKVVHHYLLEATGGELSIEGDPDAEAIDVAWFPLGDVQAHLTFANERRIAQVAWERLAGAS